MREVGVCHSLPFLEGGRGAQDCPCEPPRSCLSTPLFPCRSTQAPLWSSSQVTFAPEVDQGGEGVGVGRVAENDSRKGPLK